MNSKKGTLDGRVLDPYEVGHDWFEILLPSLQLVATDHVPPEARERAHFTLSKKGLNLRDGEEAIRRRQAWYTAFLAGRLTLSGLQEYAPLIARAVELRLERIEASAWPIPAIQDLQRLCRSEVSLPGLRQVSLEAFLAVEAELKKGR